MHALILLLLACGGSAELQQPNPPPEWPMKNVLDTPARVEDAELAHHKEGRVEEATAPEAPDGDTAPADPPAPAEEAAPAPDEAAPAALEEPAVEPPPAVESTPAPEVEAPTAPEGAPE